LVCSLYEKKQNKKNKDCISNPYCYIYVLKRYYSSSESSFKSSISSTSE
jgi:hypothetical protein